MTKFIIGVISDTHGLLRPEAIEALLGSQHIIHAGDIGDPEIIPALQKIAPVTAIRGNVDHEAWTKEFSESETEELAGISIFILHDVNRLDLDPAAAGFEVVISGHSHRPGQEVRNGVLYFNPGSAGPRRFRLPVSVGRLVVENRAVRGEIIELRVQS